MQRGLRGECRTEHRVARHEAHDHLGALAERRPVLLGGERGDVPPEAGGVLGEQGRALVVGEVLGLRVEERAHRGLGVDDEHLAAGQADDDVGPHAAVVGTDRGDLLVEVAARQHPRRLEHAAQLHLPPRPAHGRGAQRPGQRRGLPAEVLGLALHARQQRPQRAELLHAVALERAHVVLDAHEGVLERRQERRGLHVLGQRGLEVEHAFAQQVALGHDRCGPGRVQQPAHDDRDPDPDDQTHQGPHPSAHAADSPTGHRQARSSVGPGMAEQTARGPRPGRPGRSPPRAPARPVRRRGGGGRRHPGGGGRSRPG